MAIACDVDLHWPTFGETEVSPPGIRVTNLCFCWLGWVPTETPVRFLAYQFVKRPVARTFHPMFFYNTKNKLASDLLA